MNVRKIDHRIGDLFKLKKAVYTHPDWDHTILLLIKIDKERKYNGDWLHFKCFFNNGLISDHLFVKSDVRKLC